jgi:hypothetical protein
MNRKIVVGDPSKRELKLSPSLTPSKDVVIGMGTVRALAESVQLFISSSAVQNLVKTR